MDNYRPAHMGPLFMCDELSPRVCLWHSTLSKPCPGHPVDSVCVWVGYFYMSGGVYVWENEGVFLLLCAWQCPQQCHPECVSSSSAMTKISNDTHVHRHPHIDLRSPICAAVSGCFGTLRETRTGKRPHDPTPCVFLSTFFLPLLSPVVFYILYCSSP